MKAIDLEKFCSKRAAHFYNIAQPFSRGEYTYATNGHILVRVPKIEEVTNDKGPKEVEQMFNQAEFERGVTVWQPLPEFKLETRSCEWCSGKGYVKPCPAYTDANIKCENGEGKQCKEHNDDCSKACDPTEKGAFVCEECEGEGKLKLPGKNIVQGAFGKTQISAIYLDMLKDLPGIMIAPHDETSFFRFKFDGGDGLLMPMKMD